MRGAVPTSQGVKRLRAASTAGKSLWDGRSASPKWEFATQLGLKHWAAFEPVAE